MVTDLASAFTGQVRYVGIYGQGRKRETDDGK